MTRVKILNPILHADLDLYNRIRDVSRATWISRKHDEIFSFFYQGGSDKTELVKDILYLNCNDNFNANGPNVSYIKMLLMFQFCLQNYNFDFLYRVSNSTFVNYNLLSKFLKNTRAEKLYTGCCRYNIGPKRDFPPYIHGHAILISRDLVEMFVNNTEDHILKEGWHDDVILGDFLGRNNINFYDQPDLMKPYNPDNKEPQELMISHRCKPMGINPNQSYHDMTDLEHENHFQWVNKCFTLLHSLT